MHTRRSIPLRILSILVLAPLTQAQAFDAEALRELDREALRKAEARMSEFFEPGGDQLAREPATPEERYLLQHLAAEHAEMTRPPRQTLYADGTRLIEHPRSLTHFSRIEVDEQGQPFLQCGAYRPPFGQGPADFRFPGAAVSPGHAAQATVTLPMPVEAKATTPVAKSLGPVIEVIYLDPAGFGFFDTRAVTPLPGNPATTLGAQRQVVLKAALDVWGSRLDSNVPIRVQARFHDFGCGDGDEVGTVGTGGPTLVVSNFSQAPQADTNYPVALATALAGQRFGGAAAELSIRLHSRIDEELCLQGIPEGFWYGLDMDTAPALGTFSFYALVVHELAHGLGFAAMVNMSTGSFLGNPPLPDIYSGSLFSLTLQRTWSEMTAAQRVTTSTDAPNLVWLGEHVNLHASERLLPPGEIRVQPSVAGVSSFQAFIHGFPPFLDRTGLTAPLVVASNPIDDPPDAGRASTDACQPLLNSAEVAGSIVLATRGSCFFSLKWQHVYEAGGAALLLADNLPANHESALQRNTQMALATRLPIPIWSITQAAGNSLLQHGPATVTLGYNEDGPVPGTNAGLVVMEGTTDSGGSNVHHFARDPFPPSVMASSISNATHSSLPDMVPDLLRDIGWPMADAKQGQFSGSWFAPARSGEGCQLILEADQHTFILTCYLYLGGEQVWLLGTAVRNRDVLAFDDVHITRGAQYGEAFDPDEVERIAWGRIRMQLFDCNNALFEFHPSLAPYNEFMVSMTKLAAGNCQRTVANQPDRSLAGSYFQQERSGEGIQIAQEANGTTVILTYYTYSGGEQLWAIGTGTLQGDRVQFNDMHITRGGDYGPGLDPDAVERIAFGTVTVDRLDCNQVRVQIDPVLPELDPSDRVLTRIVTRQC
ncbi:MAG TPA: hypothetical protein PKZ76_00155 [Xanthomonadaceae bacterium]|nr:hypothetical protein [Xanthomonadaceae bacterium]